MRISNQQFLTLKDAKKPFTLEFVEGEMELPNDAVNAWAYVALIDIQTPFPSSLICAIRSVEHRERTDAGTQAEPTRVLSISLEKLGLRLLELSGQYAQARSLIDPADMSTDQAEAWMMVDRAMQAVFAQ